MSIQYVDQFPRSIVANPSFQLFADSGLTIYPLDAGNNYAPVLSMAVRLGPGTLPNTLSTVLLPGQITPTQVSAAFEINSTTGGLLLPRVTLTQRNLMVPTNGMQVYNITSASMDMFLGGEWHEFTEGSGTGDVVGPDGSNANAIPIFGDTSGKLLADSAVEIEQVPILARIGGIQTNGVALANAIQLGPIGYLKFDSTQGPAIYVDTLSPVNFNENSSGEITTISSVFTGGVPAASSSVSALVELQSTDAVLMLNSLTTTEMNALVNPQNGYIFYNETAGSFYGRQGGTFSQLGGGGGSTFPDGTYIFPTFTVTGSSVSGVSNLGNYDAEDSNIAIVGSSPSFSFIRTTAFGVGAACTESYSVAVGCGASAYYGGVAIGDNTLTTVSNSIAVGNGAQTIGTDNGKSINLGDFTNTITNSCIAVGFNIIGGLSSPVDTRQVCIGGNMNITGERTIAIGDNIEAYDGDPNYAILMGLNISEVADEDFIFGTNIVSNKFSTKGNILIGRHINAATGTTPQHIVIGDNVNTQDMGNGIVFALAQGGSPIIITPGSLSRAPVIFCTDDPVAGGSNLSMGVNELDPFYALEVNHSYTAQNALHLCENLGVPNAPTNGGALLFSDGDNVYFTLADGSTYRINGTPV